MKNLVLKVWESYTREVMPRNASTVQRWETRRAFYAGCQMLLAAIIGNLTPGPEPETADELLLDDIDEELQQFARDVKEGRA